MIFYFSGTGNSKHLAEKVAQLGEKTYLIQYHCQLKVENLSSLNYFSYDIIGNGWDTSINQISFQVHMPKEINEDKINLYVGNIGETSSQKIEYEVEGNSVVGKVNRILDPAELFYVQYEYINQKAVSAMILSWASQ